MTSINIFQRTENRQSYAAGTVLFREGEPGDLMYIVIEGLVEIYVGPSNVATVGPGGTIGEMALLSGQPRSATAIAKTDCTLAPIDQRQFNFMVEQTPFFARQVMQILTERLRQAQQQNSPRD